MIYIVNNSNTDDMKLNRNEEMRTMIKVQYKSGESKYRKQNKKT